MSTIRQKKLAKVLVENTQADKPLSAGELLENVGYSKTIAEQPSRVIEAPGVQEELKKLGFTDDYLEEVHGELLAQQRLDYFNFPKSMEDEEITLHVEEGTGLRVINIRYTEKGKIAFYATSDAIARGKALDMAYKLRGKYAAEKHVNLNINRTEDSKLDQLIASIEDELDNGT